MVGNGSCQWRRRRKRRRRERRRRRKEGAINEGQKKHQVKDQKQNENGLNGVSSHEWNLDQAKQENQDSRDLLQRFLEKCYDKSSSFWGTSFIRCLLCWGRNFTKGKSPSAYMTKLLLVHFKKIIYLFGTNEEIHCGAKGTHFFGFGYGNSGQHQSNALKLHNSPWAVLYFYEASLIRVLNFKNKLELCQFWFTHK